MLSVAAFFVAAAAGLVQGPYPTATYDPDVSAPARPALLGMVTGPDQPAGGSPDPGGSLASDATAPSPTPTRPATRATPPVTGSPRPRASADASATPEPRRAPTQPSRFDMERTVVDIAFPVDAKIRYRYRDNYLERRVGEPEVYNHIAGAAANGTLLRAHDGIDIYLPLGSPVRAPFAGTVIDPATRWIPWKPDRYGVVVVIVSSEPQSEDYAALLVHLARADVKPGDTVTRGQRVGTLGRSGNADNPGILPHLHFELRAPFKIRVREGGRVRLLDAFNPYPSLRASDPHAR